MIDCRVVASVVASGAAKASTQVVQRARALAIWVSVSVCQLTAGWPGSPWPSPLPPQAIWLRPAIGGPKPMTYVWTDEAGSAGSMRV